MIDPFAKSRPILSAKMLQFWGTQDPNNVINGSMWYNKANALFMATEAGIISPMLLPVGTVIMSGDPNVPTGFLRADGSAVSRTTYARLFAKYGTTFGAGDGSTTFNLPDPRSRSFMASGTGSGLTARSLGATAGEETHLLITNEIPAHTHPIDTRISAGSFVGGTGQLYQSNNNGSSGGSAYTTNNTGGGAAHNVIHPVLVLSAYVKY